MIAVRHYFEDHYKEAISISKMSQEIGISLVHIELAFDTYRNKSANKALMEYRLNRLSEQLRDHPNSDIHKLITKCGLRSYTRTNILFANHFGINLVEYQAQCAQTFKAQGRSDEDISNEEGLDGCHGEIRRAPKCSRFHRGGQ